MKTAKVLGAKTFKGKRVKLVERETTGWQPCPGEAHTNPYIDNCMVCLHHRWGFVPSYAPVNVTEATAKGFAVPVNYLTREQYNEVSANKALEMVQVNEKTRYGSQSYYVVVAVKGAA